MKVFNSGHLNNSGNTIDIVHYIMSNAGSSIIYIWWISNNLESNGSNINKINNKTLFYCTISTRRPGVNIKKLKKLNFIWTICTNLIVLFIKQYYAAYIQQKNRC